MLSTIAFEIVKSQRKEKQKRMIWEHFFIFKIFEPLEV